MSYEIHYLADGRPAWSETWDDSLASAKRRVRDVVDAGLALRGEVAGNSGRTTYFYDGRSSPEDEA